MGKVIRGTRKPFLTGARWFLAAAWAGGIWRLLTLPAEEAPDVSFIPFGDKLGHIVLYCVWGILVCWAVERSFRGLSRLGVGFISVVAAILYGIVSEVYQAGIGRDADVLDVLADTVGAIAAQYLYFSPKVKAFFARAISRRAIFSSSSGRRTSSSSQNPHSAGRRTTEHDRQS